MRRFTFISPLAGIRPTRQHQDGAFFGGLECPTPSGIDCTVCRRPAARARHGGPPPRRTSDIAAAARRPPVATFPLWSAGPRPQLRYHRKIYVSKVTNAGRHICRRLWTPSEALPWDYPPLHVHQGSRRRTMSGTPAVRQTRSNVPKHVSCCNSRRPAVNYPTPARRSSQWRPVKRAPIAILKGQSKQ